MYCEGGAGYMWWPWGVCGLLMGCVCAVRKVRPVCGDHGGHGVRVEVRLLCGTPRALLKCSITL